MRRGERPAGRGAKVSDDSRASAKATVEVMTPFLRTTSAVGACAAVAFLMGALGFLPLFGGPGYESALAAGLVLALVVPVATSLELSTVRAAPLDALGRGVANGAALAGVAFATTVLHGLRVGFCDFVGGAEGFVLGPGVGALLAGAVGALAGEVASRRQRRWARRLVAVVAGLALPLASIGVSLGRFLTSPMVFAYDPFIGHFSGALYDTVVSSAGLYSYRAGSAASVLALVVLAVHLDRTDDGRLLARWRGRPGLVLVGLAALVASLGVTISGPRLGHWQTASTIRKALGGTKEGARCTVAYPRGMAVADVDRFVRDCDAHVFAEERWFGARGPDRITAFLFADAAQKAWLMGAADTYIAKPWRREVYLQAAGYPHPALGHELAHVVAGGFARGPFRVAGSFGGWLPDPGLIEGIAVAASPVDSDLTGRQWARAMKDLGLLPPLARLFALGFLGESASTAYTASGAFVTWVANTHGVAAIRAWYGGADLEHITGRSWHDLEQSWHDDLDRVDLPEAARAQAKARFDRPAVFGRRCPHVVDECKARAQQQKAAGDVDGALASLAEVRRLDPADAGARLSIAMATMRGGRVDAARALLESLAADPAASRHVRDDALEALGDLALVEGRASAAARYDEVASRVVDEDRLRTLDVKKSVVAGGSGRRAVVELLVGGVGRAPDRFRAAVLLGQWAEAAPDDGMVEYLLARQFLGLAEWSEVAARLELGLARGLSLPRVRREALRLRLVAACAVDDTAGATLAWGAYAAEPGLPEGRREAARALFRRCAEGNPTEGRSIEHP